jgi:hypothetical protein
VTKAHKNEMVRGVILLCVSSASLGLCWAWAQENLQPSPPQPRPVTKAIPRREFVPAESISDLVSLPAVSDELKISPAMLREILKTQDEAVSFFQMQQIATGFRHAFQKWQDALQSGDEEAILSAEKGLAQARLIEAEAIDQRDAVTRNLLTPAQNKRLFQILLRMEGIRSIRRPEIAAELGMDEDQQLRVQQVLEDRERGLRALGDRISSKPATQEMAKKVDAIVKKNFAKQPLSEDELKVLSDFWKKGRVNDEEVDRFDEAIDARLLNILRRSQRARIARLSGSDFDLNRLTRKAQPAAVAPKATNDTSQAKSKGK